MPTRKIAFDTNVVGPLLAHYGLQILEGVKRQEWEVYLPIIVYAEQAVWHGDTANAVVEAFGAQVIPLDRRHVETLGNMWNTLRARPRPGEGPENLWRRHRCDWLIAAMAKQEGWLLVSEDTDFQRIQGEVDLQVMRLNEFIQQHLAPALANGGRL